MRLEFLPVKAKRSAERSVGLWTFRPSDLQTFRPLDLIRDLLRVCHGWVGRVGFWNKFSMRTFHYTLYREDGDFVAQCLDCEVSSFGATEEEALGNLREALELFLEDHPGIQPIPTISEVSVGELAIA